jgi:hypothetical protein
MVAVPVEDACMPTNTPSALVAPASVLAPVAVPSLRHRVRPDRVTTVPYICGQIRLDWPVQPITNPRTAERMRISLAGITIHLEPGRYVVARFVRRHTFQVWGGAGTYAMGQQHQDTRTADDSR